MDPTPEAPKRDSTASEVLAQLLLSSARALLQQGETERALSCVEHARELAGGTASTAIQIDALRVLGSIHANTNRMIEAEDSWRQCVELQERAGDFLGASTTLADLGDLLRSADRLPEAEQAFRSSLRLSSSSPPGDLRARSLESLSILQRALGHSQDAIDSCEEALRIRTALGDIPGRIRVHRQLGNVWQRLGQLAVAVEHHRRCLELAEGLGNARELASSLINLGSTVMLLSAFEEADALFTRARGLLKEPEDRRLLAHLLVNHGMLHDSQGATREAERYMKEGLSIREALGDRAGQANCLNNLANTAHTAGRYQEAVGWAQRSIEIRSALGLVDGLTNPWFNLANALLELNQLAEAEVAAREMSRLAEESNSLDARAEAALLAALVGLRSGRGGDAVRFAEEAVALAHEEGDRQLEAEALLARGEALLSIGDLEAAREPLLTAEGTFRDLSSLFRLARTRLALASLFVRVGSADAAADRARRAREVFQKFGNVPFQWRCLVTLGEAHWVSSRRQAHAEFESAVALARDSNRPDLESEALALRERLVMRARASGVEQIEAAVMLSIQAELRRARDPEELAQRALTAIHSQLDLEFSCLHFDGFDEVRAGTFPAEREPFNELAELEAAARADTQTRFLRLAPNAGEMSCLVAVPLCGIGSVSRGAFLCGFRESTADADTAQERPSRLILLEVLAGTLALALEALPVTRATERPLLSRHLPFERLVGQSESMSNLFRTIETVAPSDASVLVLGESGTGKELVADAIHRRSKRKDSPFVAINCPSIPRDLLEAELFGHEKGAFTGAHTARPGRIVSAEGGTLFLDEIGDMEPGTQSKLLRFLQERNFERVGGGNLVRVDVRVVAATSRDLNAEIRAGRFREDLYYRLSVVPIRVPPLRERAEDIPLLIDEFLRHLSSDGAGSTLRFSSAAMERLTRYEWPGNVRELRNVVEYLSAMFPDGSIHADRLPESLRLAVLRDDIPSEDSGGRLLRRGETLDARLMSIEGDYIRKALERTSGNQSAAARLLGMNEEKLRYRMKRYGLQRKGGVSPASKSATRPAARLTKRKSGSRRTKNTDGESRAT